LIYIIGEGIIEQAQAFNDVRDALRFDCDVYLGAMWAKPLNIDLKDEVIYNMEPLYDDCGVFKIGYLETLKSNYIIDYSMQNVEYLKKHNINAFYMPYRFHDSLVRKYDVKKDIEILFVGSGHHKRRINMFNKLKREFNFIWATGVYGKELDVLISRAKVNINIHHCEKQQLEVVRLNYLIANGCNIVSEKGCEEDINKKYDKYLFFSSYENFIKSCDKAINKTKDGSMHIKNDRHDCRQANLWAAQQKQKGIR